MDIKNELVRLGEEKIQVGRELIKRLNAFINVTGINRIQRKISNEISSLQAVRTNR